MIDRFFYWMKYYLGFSSKESRGFFLLIPVLVILSFTPFILRFFKNKEAEKTFLEFQSRIDSLENLSIQLVSSPLPTFNPQDTVRSNRNQKQLENINRIPFSEADSITLQIVPGIGQATAGRIIKYRENLGGFHSQSQLLEVFGVKEETALALWEFFDFYPQVYRKIPINTASLEELSAHPYISYGEAKVLVAYRGQHGVFLSSTDLLKIKIFKAEWVEKINPYLDFE
ncbi:helix-hairpin-helix domain-containing protein [Algoriphagus sp. A40]|uniref:ComEA family DNA-binding protein n=1 Tax=Algoriphagus sp. A40 TaxID=1945863 RepID=UPI000986A267|nr:helix-hairpin-helix domain-containing protein [Algoriphagus sp. A40]OOG73154.1 competence protein ComEA [Algoriphagus sp. A40]